MRRNRAKLAQVTGRSSEARSCCLIKTLRPVGRSGLPPAVSSRMSSAASVRRWTVDSLRYRIGTEEVSPRRTPGKSVPRTARGRPPPPAGAPSPHPPSFGGERSPLRAAAASSPAIPKPLQVGGNGRIQFRGLVLLLAQSRGEALHLLLERLA